MSLDVVEKYPWKLGDCCTYLNSWPPCNPDEDWCPLNEEYYDWLKQEQSEKFKISKALSHSSSPLFILCYAKNI